MFAAKECPLLIFDWDGTLADSAALIVNSMQAAIGALQLPPRPDAAIRDLIGLSFFDAMRILFPELETDEVLRLMGEYRRTAPAHQVASEAPLFPGVEAALETLSGHGYVLAIATGKSRHGLDRSLRIHSRVKSLFLLTRCADETASKPNPLMLREILDETGFSAGQALMIGDTEYDVAMASALDMPALGVACGAHERGRLRKAGAAAVVEGVRDLPHFLMSA